MVADETKRCSYCGEQILATAIKCRFCGSMLDGDASREASGPLEPGTVVRELKIVKMLGEGGMGAVYLAEHKLTGQQVAVKVVWPELMRDPSVVRRFLEDARVMGGLQHPNIVQLLNFFEEGGRYFLVMAYIEGQTLDDMLELGLLSVPEALRISTGVLSALHYAHTRPQPVVHRDIKPANIMIRKDGHVFVTDFGVAKALGREKLTRTQGVVGTYEFMSPEQVQGQAVSYASDIYAFGITLYKMFTGVVPFPQNTDGGFECMKAHLEAPVPAVAEYREGLPPAFQNIVERALAKEPGKRFASADEMLRTLGRPADVGSHSHPHPASSERATPRVSPTPVASGGSDLRKLLLAGGGVLVVALAVVLAVVFGSGEKKTGEPWRGETQPTNWQPVRKESAEPEKKSGPEEEPMKVAKGEEKPEEKPEEKLEEKPEEVPEEPGPVYLKVDAALDKPAAIMPGPAEPEEEEPVVSIVLGGMGPKETVEMALRAVQNKDIVPLFEMLPPSYVSDVDELVRSFANSMDKEVFDKIVILTGRIVTLMMKEKDGVIKAVAGFGIPAKDDDIKKAIDAISETWALLEAMGLADLKKLKSFSSEKFARVAAPKLVDKAFALADSTQKAQVDMFLAMLSAVQVEVLETTKDEKFGEVVSLSLLMAGDTENIKMVSVEGKWIPLDIAQDWDSAMTEAGEGIAEMARELPAAKAEILSQLSAIEAVVGQVEKTGDLNIALQALGMGMGMPAP